MEAASAPNIVPLDPGTRLLAEGARLITEARSVPELTDLRDRAEAVRAYLRRHGDSVEALVSASVLKVRAERRLGELLRDMPKHPPGPPPEDRFHPETDPTPSYAEQGIGKTEAHRWQALAKLPEPVFEAEVAGAIRAGKEVTTAHLLRLAVRHQRAEVLAEAAAAEEAAPPPDTAPSAPPPEPARWQIITGDCLEVLPTLDAGAARLVFADPPYNIGIDYGGGADADLMPSADYCEWFATWLSLCRDVLTPDGSLWVLIGDEYAAEYGVALKAAGFTIRNWVKWYESFGVNCGNKFNRTSRHLFYCLKDPDRFVFNREAVTRPSDRQEKYDDPRAHPDGKVLDDVWTDIPRLAGTHAERIQAFPTQLPLALLRRVISCASAPGDLVLDPFNGSGTTGAAALALGRRYLGIEAGGHFAALARARLKEVERDTGR